jgi:hypothetical protein
MEEKRRDCKRQYSMVVIPNCLSVYQLDFPVGQPMRSCGGAVMPNTGAGMKHLDGNKEEEARKHIEENLDSSSSLEIEPRN